MSRRIGGLAVCATLVAVPGALAGQRQEERRPFRPMYEENEEPPRQLLTFDMAVHEALGDAAEGFGGEGYSTSARVNTTFARRARKLTFNIGGGGEYRYHSTTRAVADQGRHATVGLEARGRATRLTIAQSVRQLPYQQLVGLPALTGPDAGADTSPDHGLGGVSNTVYGSSVSVHRTLGRDGTLVFDYGLGLTRSGGGSSQSVQRGGGLFRRRMGRDLELRLGYHARWRQPGPESTIEPLLSHDVDAGVAFTRGLSLSRRTSLMVTTGSSIVSSDVGRQYVLTGSAGLNHMIGRTWNATLSVDRGLDFPDALPQPVVADRLALGIGGFWGRRFSLRMRATGGIGNTGLDGSGEYRTFGTEVRAGLLVRRRWQWFVEHFYFQHEASGAAIAAGLPAATYRRGVRTGLDLQLAFLDRRRR